LQVEVGHFINMQEYINNGFIADGFTMILS